MEEIKDLVITLIEKSPHLAIWVLVILYGYKILIAGSIYATIKFVVRKICDTVISSGAAPRCYHLDRTIYIDDNAKEELIELLSEVRENKDSPWVRHQDVKNLKEAWDNRHVK